jgi:stearoyl-CoA desaturase (delta-9 desaturase)
MQDIDLNPTPKYMKKIGWYFDYLKHFLGFFNVIYGPFIVLAIMYKNSVYLNLIDLVCLILFGYFKIIVTFGIFHRFFGHKVFSCSTSTAIMLNIIGATSAQRGGLWWGSKHVRHHKFCENEGDPHSLIREGFWYSWLGWVFEFKEVNIDWDYVHPEFKNLPMFITECLILFVPYLEVYFYKYFFGLKSAIIVFWATWLTIYITLGFNVFLHHDDIIPRELQKNRLYKCRAHNNCPKWIKYSIDLIGEMNHADHHRYPRKALHPSYLIDIPYWIIIYPGEKLGIFYDVKYEKIE